MTPGDVTRLLAPLARRVLLAIGVGRVRRVDDGGDLQRLQVSLLAAEDRDGVERYQPYGLSSHPMVGADAVVVSVAGSRDHPVAIAVDDRRHRPRGLQPGEVCLYTHVAGQRVTLLADGTIRIEGSAIELVGPVQVTGDVTVSGDVTAGGISLRTHRHAGGPLPS
jgi:phage gp45-like